MKNILTLLICFFLLPVFSQNNDSTIRREKTELKRLFDTNKFKEVKQKTDIPLEVLQLIGVTSYDKMDGEITKFMWAQKSKNNAWVISVRLLSCGYYYAYYLVANNTAKDIRYNSGECSFRDLKKWAGDGQPF